MNTQRTPLGRALFYSRDSGGKNDQTPAEYVAWARREAAKIGLKFQGTADAINQMLRSGQPVSGDLFFDLAVSGNLMSRPAFDLFLETIRQDRSVSHVFIPRRDRLARPDDALDRVKLERDLREQGLTLTFMNCVLPPLRRGQRQDIGEAISAVIDYHQSGAFREELADKMIYAQLQLARQGYSTGGRAPYGFRRNLIRPDGTVVRLLSDGEIIRQVGHHVVWLPGPPEELKVIRRIFDMLATMPASRVAKILNEDGIPSPDAGRLRKDGGVSHRVSGRWHQPTVTNIARHPLMRAICQYGRRSMGDQRRMTPEGPRFLDDSEIHRNGKPKVVRNDNGESAFLAFQPVQKLKRIENKLAGGILTMGEAPSPIQKYDGPTSRRAVHKSECSQHPAGEKPTGAVSQPDSDRRSKSLGNVNRADRI